MIVAPCADLVVVGVGAFFWLRNRGATAAGPGQQRCVATAGGRLGGASTWTRRTTPRSSSGVSVRRGLAPRAASIALATAYQETGIRNLAYGDRDSVGLFQQRPVPGLGHREAADGPLLRHQRFYDAAGQDQGWENADITEVAQRVQRSGYPEAYRDHEADARVLASTLTGNSPAGFTLPGPPPRRGRRRRDWPTALSRTFGAGSTSTGRRHRRGQGCQSLAWPGRTRTIAVGNAQFYGVTTVSVAGRQWQTQDLNLPDWAAPTATPADSESRVEITVR